MSKRKYSGTPHRRQSPRPAHKDMLRVAWGLSIGRGAPLPPRFTPCGLSQAHTSPSATSLFPNWYRGNPLPRCWTEPADAVQHPLEHFSRHRHFCELNTNCRACLTRRPPILTSLVCTLRKDQCLIASSRAKKRAGGLSARTVQYHHAILRGALGQAEKWGMVPRNVARLVSPGRVPKPEIQPLTPVDARNF